MRKKVLSLIVAAMTIGTLGAFAQSETTNPTCEKATSECCIQGNKEFKGKHDGKRKFDKKRKDFNPFEGIELTAEQQQQISALKEERKAQKEADKKAKKEACAQQKKQFDEKVASNLTPEQYAQYQANCEKRKDCKKSLKVKAKKLQNSKKFEKGELKSPAVKKDKK